VNQGILYSPFPGLAISVMPDTPRRLKEKLDCELGQYRSQDCVEVGIVVSGSTHAETSERTFGLRKPGVYRLANEGIEISVGQGTLVFSELSYPLSMSISSAFPVRRAWNIIENAYKHVCLMEKDALFVHGGGFVAGERPFYLVGWSGTAKTYLAIESLREGLQLIGDDFLILFTRNSTGETMVAPYVPRCFDLGLYHLRHYDLIRKLPWQQRTQIAAMSMCLWCGQRLPVRTKLLAELIRRIGRRWSYFYLDWKVLLPNGSIQTEALYAKLGVWCVLMNSESDEIVIRRITGERLREAVRATTLQEMTPWLGLLRAIEYLGCSRKTFLPGEVLRHVDQLVAKALPNGVRGMVVYVPCTIDGKELMNKLLHIGGDK